METIFDIIDFLIDDPFTLLLATGVSALVGVGLLAGQWTLARSDIRRRTLRLSADGPVGDQASGPAAAGGSARMVSQVTASIEKLFGEGDAAASRILRKQLVQAGYYGPTAPATFVTLRIGALFILGLAGFALGTFNDEHTTKVYMLMLGGAALGYLAPPILLDRVIAKRKDEHRLGFPDFLDLMVVCCEAGLSMEASINRVCREMTEAYPSLAANLYFATLEIRAGRTVNDALSSMAERLALEEARTFATLLQQSAELGSSLVDSLKIYSDEMRNKRMMRAEEKANALPAKMVVPMILFIFPILFIVLLFPAYMKVKDTPF
jgi:tight adherence protein C